MEETQEEPWEAGRSRRVGDAQLMGHCAGGPLRVSAVAGLPLAREQFGAALSHSSLAKGEGMVGVLAILRAKSSNSPLWGMTHGGPPFAPMWKDSQAGRQVGTGRELPGGLQGQAGPPNLTADPGNAGALQGTWGTSMWPAASAYHTRGHKNPAQCPGCTLDRMRRTETKGSLLS